MHDNPFEERLLVIAEKPSVAMTIAATLGCTKKKDGYLEGPDCVVSWCFGHLAEYALPETYDEKYAKWSLDDLPIIPDRWKLVVPGDKAKQFRVLCNLLNNRNENKGHPFDYVVNCADPGREGEAIFNRVYELSGSTLPVKRLWVSSMEDDAIMNGFLDLRDASEFKNLGDAAVCRAQADWLVGMNASRAYTKVYNYRLSVGRVQTPTLAMLVDRCSQIDHFEKTQYYVTHLLVDNLGKTIDAVSEHFTEQEEANRLAGICKGRMATIPSIERQTNTIAPPKLYDLTTLQRDANRLFGMTAGTTLQCAQTLYENKLITYPRTDSNYLTDDMGQTALEVLNTCIEAFPFLEHGSAGADTSGTAGSGAVSSGIGRPDAAIRKLLNSRKVTDHYAIIPTKMIAKADLSGLTADQKRILVMIAARLACATAPKHVYETVKATFLCCGYPFTAYGRSVKEEGWKAIDASMRACLHASADDDTNEQSGSKENGSGTQDLSSLYQGAQFAPVSTGVTDHWTKPPKQYTEDTLLHAMEKAGTAEMEEDVERKGLGTPATRASVIDKLVFSNYVRRDKRQLIPTEAGKQLVAVLPEYLKSAQMTADWENRLLMIERGQYDAAAFMAGIKEMLLKMLEECRQIDEKERTRFGGSTDSANARGGGRPGRESLGKCPACGAPVYEGEKNFYCSDRDCRFVLWKESRYLSRMRAHLTAGMVRDLLKNGRTTVRNLYSPKKDKFYTADILLEWKDSKTVYRLDFPPFN